MVPMNAPERVFKYEEVAAGIADLIKSGALRPGDPLPSVRELSRQRSISITTVLQGYYALEDRGLVQARARSGFYVQTRLPADLLEPDISSPPPDPMSVSVRDLIMMVLRDAENPRLVQMGAAYPNPGLTATAKLDRILAALARRPGGADACYELPVGPEALRAQIARRAAATGCNLSPEDILTTTGCTEAMNLCLRAVCRPGDTVAVESPICFDTLQYLEALGLKALEIPTHPRDGISLDALRFAIAQMPVRVCIVISNFNNPLGSCIPDGNKRELVRMLAAQDIPLIENNVFGEIYFGAQPPGVAKSYDRKGLVMLCSSFSKDLCPSYRVGWVAPGRFKRDVEWLKYSSSFATATLPQLAIAEFMSSGAHGHHLRGIRQAYARRVAGLLQAISRYFPPDVRLTRPAGGFVVWVQLPEKVDSLALYRLALRERIAITPGDLFSATNRYRNFIRLNAANWSEQAEAGVRRLGELVGELAG
jgi:DNA-binding transcriptional MocR family regulator